MATSVLLVEDSRAMRNLVCSILETHGDYAVDEVDNGFEALRLLPRADYALIVVDINMPDVSGLEIIRFVRESRQHAKTPIVVISTDASEGDVRRAMAMGASTFVAKPFATEEFVGALERVMEPHPGARAAP